MSGVVERSLTIEGHTTRLRIFGEGPHALLLFPAVMDSGSVFGRTQLMLRSRLDAGIASIAIDLPGYDGAGSVPEFSAWPSFCEGLIQAIAQEFTGNFVCAGNSSGAVAATEAALCSPNARGLVWICWCDWQQTAPRSAELLCPADESAAERLRTLSWHRPPELGATGFDPAHGERYRAHVASFDATRNRRAFAAFDGPALIIAGASDGLVPVAEARLSASIRPRTQLEVIEACGHYPQREKPAVLADLLARFVHSQIRT